MKSNKNAVGYRQQYYDSRTEIKYRYPVGKHNLEPDKSSSDRHTLFKIPSIVNHIRLSLQVFSSVFQLNVC
jgi:hypothetical protein